MAEKQIVVIGGGAAGFFAAINIAEKLPYAKVLILEKTNQLLTKVKVSGGGRCNLTHACFEPNELIENYPRGEKELRGPFHHFAVGDTIEWFAEKGVEVKMEEDGRMFPESNSSQTIIDCFLKECKRLKIGIHTSAEVVRVEKDDNFTIHCKNGGIYQADVVVVAIGGNPKPKHYGFIDSIGHQFISPIPSLFTFNLPKHSSNQLMGLSVQASVNLCGTDYEEEGPLLFTHWGMSGPAILKLSSKAADYLHKCNYQFDFEVCWMERATEFIVDQRKHKAASKVAKHKIEEIPNRLWTYLLDRASIDQQLNWGDLNKNQLQNLEEVLTKDAYRANGKTTFKEEFVTCGGVVLKEIEMKSMESKILASLYFCGEVINVDAVTGGFNFQAAWTTAYLVSESISEKFANIK